MSDLRLDHIVIAVRDLDAATDDYTALLGRLPSWRGTHPSYGTRNVLFRIENTYVELLGVGGDGGSASRWPRELGNFLDEHGEGLFMLALTTPGVDETVRELRAKGVELHDAADGEGFDELTGERRHWRNAPAPLRDTRGVRLLFIEHRSHADALPVAPFDASESSAVRRADHVVVLSTDLEASRRLWAGVLGARLALDRTFPDRNARILFFRLGDVTVEISGGAVQTEEGLSRPDRLWGMAWGVDDAEATCRRLAAAGFEVSGPRAGAKPGTRVATVRGDRTHGLATLLIEHAVESFRPEARKAQGSAFDNAAQRRAFTLGALDHVVLSVSDVDATSAKWADLLGLRVSDDVTPEGTHMRLAKLPAGNAFVELAQPLTEDHRIAKAIAERGAGMFSISLAVDDLAAAVSDLRVKGVPVSDPEPGVWPGTMIARINKSAANGVSIQLIQRMAG